MFSGITFKESIFKENVQFWFTLIVNNIVRFFLFVNYIVCFFILSSKNKKCNALRNKNEVQQRHCGGLGVLQEVLRLPWQGVRGVLEKKDGVD